MLINKYSSFNLITYMLFRFGLYIFEKLLLSKSSIQAYEHLCHLRLSTY